MTHDIIDLALGVGTVAATLMCCFIAIYLPRRLDRRDKAANDVTTETLRQNIEIGKQGDRLSRHTCEIRHLQQQTGHTPFDPNWDR